MGFAPTNDGLEVSPAALHITKLWIWITVTFILNLLGVVDIIGRNDAWYRDRTAAGNFSGNGDHENIPYWVASSFHQDCPTCPWFTLLPDILNCAFTLLLMEPWTKNPVFCRGMPGYPLCGCLPIYGVLWCVPVEGRRWGLRTVGDGDSDSQGDSGNICMCLQTRNSETESDGTVPRVSMEKTSFPKNGRTKERESQWF